MNIEPTRYYDEFIRYFELATKQQELCNFGDLEHEKSGLGDALMENVHLYDVVERKYAGFSQIMNDCFYGWTPEHPYWRKMEAGNATIQRQIVAHDWTGKHADFKLPEWLYIFILHRVTGSAINYATKPSGYHNTLLFNLHACKTIEEMVKMVNLYHRPFYTSIGYQFPSFPKPPSGSKYKRGGDYYLSEYAPRLARDMAEWLESGGKRDLREIGGFMLDWNVKNGLRQYFFQYAAVVADVADWYPQYVNKESLFYYGTNAKECISYLAVPKKKMSQDVFLDEVMNMIYADTGSYPYNAEDVCCDFIRYLENYVRPGASYEHLDLDNVWNSSNFIHPYGRQRAMLELGLVKTFNGMNAHPSDDKVISSNNMTEKEYIAKVKMLYPNAVVPNTFS